MAALGEGRGCLDVACNMRGLPPACLLRAFHYLPDWAKVQPINVAFKRLHKWAVRCSFPLPFQLDLFKRVLGTCECVCELRLLLRDTKVLILGGNALQLATAAAATKNFFLSFTETAKYAHKQIYFHYDCTHTHVLTLLHTHTYTPCSWPNCNCAYLLPSRSEADVFQRPRSSNFNLCSLHTS